MPVKVIARLLGIPGDDYGNFKRWSDAFLSLVSMDNAKRMRLSQTPSRIAFILAKLLSPMGFHSFATETRLADYVNWRLTATSSCSVFIPTVYGATTNPCEGSPTVEFVNTRASLHCQEMTTNPDELAKEEDFRPQDYATLGFAC
jgi:hypothetical protein